MLTAREQVSNGLQSAFIFFLTLQGVIHIGEIWKPELSLPRSGLSEYWIFFVLAAIVGFASRNAFLPMRFANMARPQDRAVNDG